jgi:hypothetical protein
MKIFSSTALLLIILNLVQES